MINKHVAFARTDVIITQIYSSPRLRVLLHFGKSRARFSRVTSTNFLPFASPQRPVTPCESFKRPLEMGAQFASLEANAS